MENEHGLPGTVLSYIVQFYTGGIGALTAVALFASPAAVVLLVYAPDAIPYLVLAATAFTVNVTAMSIELAGDGEYQLSEYSWEEMSVYVVTSALYFSTVLGGAAAIGATLAPFETATWASMIVAFFLAVADLDLARRVGLSPGVIPVVVLLLVFYAVGTIEQIRLKDRPLIGVPGSRRNLLQ